MDKLDDAHPWWTDLHYFKNCKISLKAVIKMLNHSKLGFRHDSNDGVKKWFEVMGSLVGKYEGDTFYISDAIPLPVEASEVRVTLGKEATEFIVNYTTAKEKGNVKENVVGWYHSHPSYKPFLSGIDVDT